MRIKKSKLIHLIKEELNNVLNEYYPGQPGSNPPRDCPKSLKKENALRKKYGDDAVDAYHSCDPPWPGQPACVQIEKCISFFRNPRAHPRFEKIAACMKEWTRHTGDEPLEDLNPQFPVHEHAVKRK